MKKNKTRIQGFFTVKAAAKYLKVHPITLKRWEAKGLIAGRRHPMNRYRIYTREDIEKIKKMIEEGGEE